MKVLLQIASVLLYLLAIVVMFTALLGDRTLIIDGMLIYLIGHSFDIDYKFMELEKEISRKKNNEN